MDETRVGVHVDQGVVTLTGTVASYAEQLAVQDAVHCVTGVLDVANDIHIRVLRNMWGPCALDAFLAERDRHIHHRLSSILDVDTEQGGLKIDAVGIKRGSRRRRCTEPWPNRRKPNGSGAPQASRRRGNARRSAAAAEIIDHHPMSLSMRLRQT